MKKKNFFIISIIIILIIIICSIFFKKQNTEYDKTPDMCPFSVSKIMVFSSASGENKNANFQQKNWILDIFQYSDIAVYLNNNGTRLNSNNTIKKLSIENVSFLSPKIGTPSLFYLDSSKFGTPTFNNEYEIKDKFDFDILNDENLEANLNYNTPIFFADCSNPITLKYVNNQIKTDYEITSNEPISFTGKLLELAGITLNSIETTIKFDIVITNNNNEQFYCTIDLPIELENNNDSILKGNISTEKNGKEFKFMRK